MGRGCSCTRRCLTRGTWRCSIKTCKRRFPRGGIGCVAVGPGGDAGRSAEGLTPEFRASGAVSKEGDRIGEWRDRGFVLTHLIPEGRLANGRSCVLVTTGLPKREAVLREAGLPSFGLIPLRGNGYPATRMGGMAHLRQALLDAQDFQRREDLYRRGSTGVSRPPEDRCCRN